MKYLKLGVNLFYVLLMLFVKSSLEQGFTPFGLLGFGGRPPLFQGFGPPPPGVQTFLPPPIGFPGIPGPPPFPIISPLTAFGGAGSLTLPSETAPSTLDLSGFSNSVQTLPDATSSIVSQSGFDGGLLTLGESTNTLNNQNLITTLTGQDALLGGTVTSLTNDLATGVITSDAGVPDGVNPASAVETSFVSRFSNSNDGGSLQTTVNGQLNSFDSVPGTSQQTFDASSILNTVFGNSNSDPSSSRVSRTGTENSPTGVLLTRGVSNNATPNNLIQRQTVSVRNTGEGIPTMNELQQMFTPTELSNNVQESAVVNGIGIQSSITASGGDVSRSGNRQVRTDPSGRNDATRRVNINSVTTVNQINADRNPSQINTPVDELSMDFRNFIRADGGQTDPSDILSRIPQSRGTVFTPSNERMVMPSNSIFTQGIDDPNAGSRTTITETEIRSRTNTRTGTQDGLITSSFATDPGIMVLDNTPSSRPVGGGMNQDAITISRNGNNFDASLRNRETDPVKKTSVVINGNSNIVGSKVDVQNSDTKFVNIPQSVDLKRSEFQNTKSTVRNNLDPAAVLVNSMSDIFNARTGPTTNVTRQNNRIQDPELDSQRRSKIMFVDGTNSENDRSFQQGSAFSADPNFQNNAVIGNRDQSGVNFNTNFPSGSNRPGVNINFNFPVKQSEVDIGASLNPLNSITSDIGTQQRFQLTSKIPSRNVENSDPSAIDIADPSRIHSGMNSKTVQTMRNQQRSGIESNALPSGNSTSRFIKRTTTVKRISNSMEDGSGTMSQTINTRVADPSNTRFFANSEINGINSTFNRNAGLFVGDQATFNRFVSSSDSTGFTRDPQIMGVQNSLQTSRFSPGDLPGNVGNSGPFLGALGSNNGVNSRSARTRFVSASNTNNGGGVSRTVQAQNTPSANGFPNNNAAVDPSSTSNQFVSSNSGNLVRSLQNVQGTNFESSGFSRGSRQNTRMGGFVSMTDGGSSGMSQNSQRSISNILGGTSPEGSGFQTGTTTGNNFGIRARASTNFSEAGNNVVSRNTDPNAVTIIETSRDNVVLSSNPESNGGGDVNIMAQGTTLPPVNVLNDTISCKTR